MLQLTLAVGGPRARAGPGCGRSCPGAGRVRLPTRPLAAHQFHGGSARAASAPPPPTQCPPASWSRPPKLGISAGAHLHHPPMASAPFRHALGLTHSPACPPPWLPSGSSQEPAGRDQPGCWVQLCARCCCGPSFSEEEMEAYGGLHVVETSGCAQCRRPGSPLASPPNPLSSPGQERASVGPAPVPHPALCPEAVP